MERDGCCRLSTVIMHIFRQWARNHRYYLATIYVSHKSWGKTLSADLVQTSLGQQFWSFSHVSVLVVG